MSPLFDAHVDPEARRQRLLEADAHTQTDDGGEGAVRDGGGDEDGDGGHDGGAGGWLVGEGGRRGQSGGQGDVGEVDDGEGAEGQGVFGVLDGGYEICAEQVMLVTFRGCRG